MADAHKEMKEAIAAFRAAVTAAKVASFSELADKINATGSESRERWLAFSRTQPSSFSPLNSIPDATGALPVDETASLDNLAAEFVRISEPPPAPVTVTARHHLDVLRWLDPNAQPSNLPPHPSDGWKFTMRQVRDQCEYQRTRSAPGPDAILPIFLRHAGRTVFTILSLLFNFSWRHAVLPQAWRQADVMALYKGAADEARGKPAGQRSDASSYRPISMTSIIIRTFEHMVQRRLAAELESRDFFHPLQFGFRKGRTTAGAINHLLSTIRRINTERSPYHIPLHQQVNGLARTSYVTPCPVVFLDIAKAFDRVWPEHLLRCLHDAGITGAAWRWLRAFLSGRRIRTVQLDLCSHWHSIRYGVPQGCVLSPLLFLVFIQPVLDRITAACPCVDPVAFADDGALAPRILESDPQLLAAERQRRQLPANADIALYRPFDIYQYRDDLRKALRILDDWCETSRVRFGSQKTQLVIFSGAQQLPDPQEYDNFRLCGFTIAVSPTYTYLGVLLHHKLSWQPQIDRALAAARRASYRITRIVRNAAAPNFPFIRTLVLGLLMPSFTYGIAFWGRNCSEDQLRTFNSALTQPLRRALGLPRTTNQLGVCVETSVPSTAAWMQREQLLLYHRISSLPWAHPSRQMHELDLSYSVDAPKLILVTAKRVSTSRHVQLQLLPQLASELYPFILANAPPAPAQPVVAAAAAAAQPAAAARPSRLRIRDVLLPLPPPPASFAYLKALVPGEKQRAAILRDELTPAVLTAATNWADLLAQHLTVPGIKLLTMWATHREWRKPQAGEEHHSAAPLLQCLPYPQRAHYLWLEDSKAASLRARLRARRALTEEHRQRLEGKQNASASPACTFTACAQQQPSPPVDSVPHILCDCPRHAARRAQLTTDYRATTRNPAAQLTLPFILGCAFSAAHLSKSAAARFAALLQLTASFFRDVDDERQKDGLRPFEPP